MLLRPGSHLTDSGRPTPCSPSWRACDYADQPSRENQRSIAKDDAPQGRRGIIRQSALSLRTRSQAGGAAPEECVVLSDAARGRGGRPVYDADPHLPVMWRQLVRLPDRTAAACPGTDGQSRSVDAVELPREAKGRWSMMYLHGRKGSSAA